MPTTLRSARRHPPTMLIPHFQLRYAADENHLLEVTLGSTARELRKPSARSRSLPDIFSLGETFPSVTSRTARIEVAQTTTQARAGLTGHSVPVRPRASPFQSARGPDVWNSRTRLGVQNSPRTLPVTVRGLKPFRTDVLDAIEFFLWIVVRYFVDDVSHAVDRQRRVG